MVGAVVEGETRIVPVKAELDNSNGTLKPGMFVELEVLTSRTPAAVLAIPKSAVVETNDKKAIVFVQNGSAFQSTDVTLGRESGEFVEVKDGLFDGDQIVTQRAPQLYAQSLRGGSKATPEEHHSEAAVVSQGQVPWWVIPISGAVAVGTFWAGTTWSDRRFRRRSEAINHTESNGAAHDTEIYLHSAQRSTLKTVDQSHSQSTEQE